MFLRETIARNHKLIEDTLRLHGSGDIAPDTYVIDVDTFLENARKIRKATDKDLYFMLKQVGRNPYLARKLMDIGYQGCVAVDFREALTMMRHGIHLCNVGHLVQIPRLLLKEILQAKPDYITCFTIDKIKEIDATCADIFKGSGYRQKIMLRVVGENDVSYPAQEGGFPLDSLHGFPTFENVEIAGVTSFPCCLDGKPTPNYHTLQRAKEILESQGFAIDNINAPSANCSSTIPLLSLATSLEPGHGLSGTQPMPNQPETPCVVYLSEVSHNYAGRSYIYGGGYYRRGHIQNALADGKIVGIDCPAIDSIDYHFMLDREFAVSTPVVMAFRFQMFVTRASVALIEGGRLQGIYSPLGEETYV